MSKWKQFSTLFIILIAASSIVCVVVFRSLLASAPVLITDIQFSTVRLNEIGKGTMFNSHNASKCDAYLLLLSTVGASEMRQVIRNGWLSDLTELKWPPANFKYKFVVGRDAEAERSWSQRTGRFEPGRGTEELLREEIGAHGDITVLPFMDDYWNLTVKVGIMFKWPEFASECNYLFKIDEDVFMRAERFATLLRALPVGQLTYGGYVYDQVRRQSKVSRIRKNRHSLTEKEFPAEFFDPYAGGPVYFLSALSSRSRRR